MQTVDENKTEILINKGFEYHQNGLFDDAEALYMEALDSDKNNAQLYNLLGVLKFQKSDVDSAIGYIQKAISLSKSEYYYESLFQVFIRKEDFEQILSYENEVTTLYPKNFTLLFNLGYAYKKLGNFDRALMYYEKALEVDPTSYEGWYNLANLYRIMQKGYEAVSAMEICHKLKPNDDETSYYLGVSYMRIKNYAKGLPLFEKRLSKKVAFASHNKTTPNLIREDNFWRGENIKDKNIFVYYEAGFGDLIMFARYLPLLAKRCKKVTLMCHKELTPLFKINKHLGVDEFQDRFIPNNNIDVDVHASILSLPYLLGLKGDDIFVTPEGYIVPDMDMVEEYRKKYFDNDKIKVGIKWRGNTTLERNRTIPAELFNQLMQRDDTQFYSFQTLEGSEDTSKLEGIIDIGRDLTDFSQTAAALRNLDIVICNDTSLAHLAGAMRIPCWVMLPAESDWRWHTDLTKCDWYESVRLFRQQNCGDWQSVFDKVLTEMQPE